VHLDRIGRLWLLPALLGRVTVPATVAAEVNDGDRAIDLAALPWVTVSPDLEVSPEVPKGLHAGEAVALTLALHTPGAVVLIDERDGRRAAVALGLPLLGTGRLVVEAKAVGLIPAVRPVLLALRATSFRLSDAVIQRLCAMAGE
jgi:predicted nucleic acid-binding protein